MPYKYKLSEMSKTASPEEAEKELGIPKRKFEIGQVTYSDDGTRKSEIVDIDPNTGQVSWKITQLPGFDKLYDELTDLVTTAKRTYVKTKDDKKFRDFYDEIRGIRNKVRTHLRNEYPDQYKRIVTEEEVDEISTTGGGAGSATFSAGTGMQYATPYAFRRKGAKPDDEEYMKLGYRLAKEGTCGYDRSNKGKKLKGPGGLGEGDTYEKMAAKGKKAGSLKQGTVRKRLGIKKGEKIPLSLINKELSRLKKMDKDDDKKGVQLGDKNQKYYKALQLSKTLKTTTNVDENKENPGATLGPGPKATEDGVKDNYIVKAFKYKLVPKNKDGTYVQKDSGLEVKKLF